MRHEPTSAEAKLWAILRSRRYRDIKFRRRPKSNTGYWNPKLEGNVARDKRNRVALKKAGWDVLVIWDCETQSSNLRSRIEKFLGPVR